MSPLCKIKGTGAKNDVVIGPAVRLVSPTRRHDGSLILPEGTLGRLQAHNLRAPKSQMSLARTKKPLPLPKKLNEGEFNIIIFVCCLRNNLFFLFNLSQIFMCICVCL